MLVNDEYIINKYWAKKSPTLSRYLNSGKVTEDEKQYLLNRYNECDNIIEALYRIKYNIKSRPVCPICGAEIQYNTKLNCFNQFCSKTCANKNPELIKRRKETFVERYGCEVPSKTTVIIEKVKQTWKNKTQEEIDKRTQKTKNTCLDKYGCEFYQQTKQSKQHIQEINKHRTQEQKQEIINKTKRTKLERYGDENYVNADKAKETCLKRYGTPTYLQSNECKKLITEFWNGLSNEERNDIINKRKQTKLERYGDENYVNTEKIKETILNKYGVESVLVLSEVRMLNIAGTSAVREKAVKTIKEKFGDDNYANRQKYKETCKEKYGVKHYSQTKIWKKKQSKKMSSPEVQKKRSITLKKNKSTIFSNPENLCYELLSKNFDNVIRQYISDDYPFNCDFYIPSINLYIEYNGNWTHGGHPFNKEDKNDVELSNIWINKEKKYYHQAYYVWTDLDVRKRNIAKENGIWLIEFWDINEVKKWLETLNS